MKRIKLLAAAVLLFAALLPAACGPAPVQESAVHADRAVPVKKGVAVSRYAEPTEENAAKISSLGAGWYYDWGCNVPNEALEAEYVPMAWGTDENTLNKVKSGYLAGDYRYLLTFNEPDGSRDGGGNPMSVEEAIAAWPKLEELGIPLSSPATTNYSTGWLDDFMREARKKKYRVDFIALHCYQDFSDAGAVNTLRKELTEIYKKYGLPIWITEFGAIDISHWAHPGEDYYNPACTQSAATSYAKKVTAMLEGLGFVERYAWFLDNYSEQGAARPREGQYSALYTDADALSATGEAYRAVRSQTGLCITGDAPAEGRAGKSYEAHFTTSGGTGDYKFSATPPLWSDVAAALPKGLTLSPAGDLTGKPSSAGEFTVCVAVTDASGQVNFLLYTLIIY